ncbi:helix-turn-helix domain-containing protein [Rhodococcus artemisiae]|uniref:Helix-turn-helix domain-containing protein n=1 Tax=Rhodococcus artemisiae TaxID=714159 RepID=A0ABU7LHQ1_9NOCA|nr:helix-turn-helix domain-containing protein [Rhodococcus artemisiae]MEE2061073.1 helix-turn-helix domain-containing protein [Rhodococcus artemisiae]
MPEEDRVARIGAAIRAARKRDGLSARILAERAGVSQAFLSQVERGLNAPSLATLYKIADALGRSPSSFLDPAPDADVLVVRAEGRIPQAVTGTPTAPVTWLARGNGVISEVYQYLIGSDDDVSGWFRRADDLVVVVTGGSLEVQVRDREPVVLVEGDCLFAAAGTEMQWAHRGEEPAHIVLCVGVTPEHP